MPVQVKCPNVSCGTLMSVKEEYAGQTVACPRCSTPTVVPGGTAIPVVPMVPAAPPPPLAPTFSQAPQGPLPEGFESSPIAPPDIMATVKKLCGELNLDDMSQKLLAGGMIAFALLWLAMLLPRASLSISVPLVGINNSMTYYWISTTAGALMLLFTMVAAGFVGAAFVKIHNSFQTSLYAAAGWAALAFLIILICIFTDGTGVSSEVKGASVSIGIGSFLGLLASGAAAAAFGYLAKLRKPQPPSGSSGEAF